MFASSTAHIVIQPSIVLHYITLHSIYHEVHGHGLLICHHPICTNIDCWMMMMVNGIGLELRSVDIFPFSSRPSSQRDRDRDRDRASSTPTHTSSSSSTVTTNPSHHHQHSHGSFPTPSMRTPLPTALITPVPSSRSSSRINEMVLERSTSSTSMSTSASIVRSSSVSFLRELSDADDAVSRSLGFDSFIDATPRHSPPHAPSSPLPAATINNNGVTITHAQSTAATSTLKVHFPSSNGHHGITGTTSSSARRRGDHDCMLILELVNSADTTFRLHCTIDGGTYVLSCYCPYLTTTSPSQSHAYEFYSAKTFARRVHREAMQQTSMHMTIN